MVVAFSPMRTVWKGRRRLERLAERLAPRESPARLVRLLLPPAGAHPEAPADRRSDNSAARLLQKMADLVSDDRPATARPGLEGVPREEQISAGGEGIGAQVLGQGIGLGPVVDSDRCQVDSEALFELAAKVVRNWPTTISRSVDPLADPPHCHRPEPRLIAASKVPRQ
jgi:hypothetical protein